MGKDIITTIILSAAAFVVSIVHQAKSPQMGSVTGALHAVTSRSLLRFEKEALSTLQLLQRRSYLLFIIRLSDDLRDIRRTLRQRVSPRPRYRAASRRRPYNCHNL
jgi:hypothetical protein